MSRFILAIAVFNLLFLVGCQAQKDKQAIYEYGKKTRFGTGKYYMGREISQIMGHQGAPWLEREDREEQERTDIAIDLLPLDEDDVVADIGAGTGYYTFRISKRVPKGKVLAVDVQLEMLEMLSAKNKELGIDNVEPILGAEKSPKLAPNSVDLVLFVDVYHELAYPYEMMQEIVSSLKADGKVVFLEYRAEDPNVPIKKLHKMSAKQVIKEMEAVGLQFVENKGQLPWQHFMIFGK